jgi:hypothetical protein
MPLVIGFAFFIGIVAAVVLGSHLLGPESWPIQSDRETARRAQAKAEDAEQLRQRLRGAVPRARWNHLLVGLAVMVVAFSLS